MVKIRSKKELEIILKDKGFNQCGGTKHEKWTNGEKTVVIPRNSHHWSMRVAARLYKEIIDKSNN